MNASLKADHLGVKGSAFVVIANELKATADQVPTRAGRLKQILDKIEQSANDLKQLRVDGDPTQLAKLEPSILHAIREIEAGNEQLSRVMNRLVHGGAQFEGLMTGAQTLMTALGEAVFSDFSLVAADQLFNWIAKARHVFSSRMRATRRGT